MCAPAPGLRECSPELLALDSPASGLARQSVGGATRTRRAARDAYRVSRIAAFPLVASSDSRRARKGGTETTESRCRGDICPAASCRRVSNACRCRPDPELRKTVHRRGHPDRGKEPSPWYRPGQPIRRLGRFGPLAGTEPTTRRPRQGERSSLPEPRSRLPPSS